MHEFLGDDHVLNCHVHDINLDDCLKPIQQTHPLIINLGDYNSCEFEVITTRSPRPISHGSIIVKRN